jgi:hypothetical protein
MTPQIASQRALSYVPALSFGAKSIDYLTANYRRFSRRRAGSCPLAKVGASASWEGTVTGTKINNPSVETANIAL